jgi:hypothetical protein
MDVTQLDRRNRCPPEFLDDLVDCEVPAREALYADLEVQVYQWVSRVMTLWMWSSFSGAGRGSRCP